MDFAFTDRELELIIESLEVQRVKWLAVVNRPSEVDVVTKGKQKAIMLEFRALLNKIDATLKS